MLPWIPDASSCCEVGCVRELLSPLEPALDSVPRVADFAKLWSLTSVKCKIYAQYVVHQLSVGQGKCCPSCHSHGWVCLLTFCFTAPRCPGAACVSMETAAAEVAHGDGQSGALNRRLRTTVTTQRLERLLEGTRAWKRHRPFPHTAVTCMKRYLGCVRLTQMTTEKSALYHFHTGIFWLREVIDLCIWLAVCEATRLRPGLQRTKSVIVRSPFGVKHHVVVQYMAAGLKCPLPPPPCGTPSPCGTPLPEADPPCSQTSPADSMTGRRQGGQWRIDEQGRIDNITDTARDFALQLPWALLLVSGKGSPTLQKCFFVK